jgi:hypothetical protein
MPDKELRDAVSMLCARLEIIAFTLAYTPIGFAAGLMPYFIYREYLGSGNVAVLVSVPFSSCFLLASFISSNALIQRQWASYVRLGGHIETPTQAARNLVGFGHVIGSIFALYYIVLAWAEMAQVLSGPEAAIAWSLHLAMLGVGIYCGIKAAKPQY